MKIARTLTLVMSTALLLSAPLADVAARDSAGNRAMSASGSQSLEEQRREIAKGAYIYGFPMVEMYKTLYTQAVDTKNPNYLAPLNRIGSHAQVFTPRDSAFITPNSDTPYSMLWADLRAEPLVLEVPKIEPGRYYSIQVIDLYTHNADYIGTRTSGNDAGKFLLAGPGWKGTPPPGIKRVIRLETEIAYLLYRTQLFSADDLKNVVDIQRKYKATPLSAFLGKAPPPKAPPIDFPKYDGDNANGIEFFSYLDFLLQFAPVNSGEVELREKFSQLGFGGNSGKRFDPAKLSVSQADAMRSGIADANAELAELKKNSIDKALVTSGEFFGTRQFLKNNYLYRFAGAKYGIFGNSGDEAVYHTYFTDAKGTPLNASKNKYTLRMASGQLPPTKAFWSMTAYDGKTQLLVDNPINRYLINSSMEKSLVRDVDGGVTLYVQATSPGKQLEANWLPVPSGPFYLVLRNYIPRSDVVSGEWKQPPLVIAK